MTESIGNSLESVRNRRFVKADKPLFVGQVISHKQYGVGVVTKLPPSNVNLVKAIFEGEDDEKIVIIKHLKTAKQN